MSSKIIIEAGRADRAYFKDLWRYRELLYVLAWRDVSVRYKQSAIGVAWAVLRPALTTAIFALVFGRLGKFPSDGIPYPVLVMTGMLPWQLFSSALSESGASLVANTNLITKVYFPRLIIPGSSLLTSCIDFSISLGMLAALMAFYGVVPGWQILLCPLFAVFALIAAASMGIWISALNVKYRDFSFVVPFVAQLGLYVSPVGFSSSIVPARWRALYSLNPMVAAIDGFRWSLLDGKTTIEPVNLIVSSAVVIIIAIGGLRYFRATEREFADTI